MTKSMLTIGRLFSLLCFLSASMARCESWPMDETLRKPIALQTKTGTVDDYLMSVARASEINVLVDATRLPPDLQVPAADVRYPVWGLIAPVATQYKLSSLRLDTQTFLFWPQPDATKVASDWVARRDASAPTLDGGFALGKTTESSSRHLDQTDIMLAEYFWREHQWNGRDPKFAKDIPLTQLPPELQKRVLERAREQVTRVALAEDLAWFRNAFWNSARLQIRDRSVPGVDPALQILVGGIVQENDRYSFATFRNAAAPGESLTRARSPVAVPAKNEAPAAPQEAAPTPLINLSLYSLAPAIAREPQWQATVSAEFVRQPLSRVLQSVAQQHGARFNLEDAAPDDQSLLTARVKDMPLNAFLNAVGNLYGRTWQKTETSLRLRDDAQSNDLSLLAIGDMVPYAERAAFEARRQEQAEFAGRLYETVNAEGLLVTPQQRLDGGLPFSSLPDAMQAQLRRRVQNAVAVNFVTQAVTAHTKVRLIEDAASTAILRAGIPTQRKLPPEIQKRLDAQKANPQLRLVTPDGQLLAQIMPSTSFSFARAKMAANLSRAENKAR